MRNATDATNMELAAISSLTVSDEDMKNIDYMSRYFVNFRAPVLYHRLTQLFPTFEEVVETMIPMFSEMPSANFLPITKATIWSSMPAPLPQISPRSAWTTPCVMSPNLSRPSAVPLLSSRCRPGGSLQRPEVSCLRYAGCSW